MAKRDNLIRIGIGIFALLFLGVPLYRYCSGGGPETNAPAQTQHTSPTPAAPDGQPPPRKPASNIEKLHAAESLTEAVAVMNLLPITFATNSTQLSPVSQPYVEEIAAAIRKLAGGQRVEITVSSADAKTAEAKARALQASLVSRGVEPATLSAKASWTGRSRPKR